MKAEKVWIDTQFDKDISWGLSLVGRAPALHAVGQEFDSPSLHHEFWRLEFELKITEFSKRKTWRFYFINFCDLSITVLVWSDEDTLTH